jgi:hypothetical protein
VPSRVGIKGRLVVRSLLRLSDREALQVHHLARYELGDGEGDDRGRTRRCRLPRGAPVQGEATEIGSQTQLDLLRIDRVDVEVDGHLRGAGVVEPVEQWRAGGP